MAERLEARIGANIHNAFVGVNQLSRDMLKSNIVNQLRRGFIKIFLANARNVLDAFARQTIKCRKSL